MRHLASLTAVLGLLLSLHAVASANAQIDTSYDHGYEAGYAIGYDLGVTEGTTRGVTEGTENGDAAGYQDGWDFGYTPAYDSAFASSHLVGLRSGFSDTFGDAFLETAQFLTWRLQNSGVQLTSGLAQGLSGTSSVTLTSSGSWNGTVSGSDFLVWNNNKFTSVNHWREGYDDGYEIGYDDGDLVGYDLSYQPAFDDAYDIAYPRGVTEGGDQGQADGSDDGYSDGFELGESTAEHYATVAADEFIRLGGSTRDWSVVSEEYASAAFATAFPNETYSDTTNGGTDLLINTVPEPGAFVMAFLALLACRALRRR